MAVFLDQVSSRLESTLAGFRQPSSLVSLSASSSGDFSDGCPSLTASNSLSSQGSTELETDAATPPRSPFITSVHVLACTSEDSRDALSWVDEVDATTPRPLCAERRSYFVQAGKAYDEEYEAKRETIGPWNIDHVGVKRRHRTVRNREANAFTRAVQTNPISRDPAANGFVHHGAITRKKPGSSSLSFTQEADAKDSLIRMHRPTHIDIPVPGIFLPHPKVKKQYFGLGLGLPMTWNDQRTPRACDVLLKKVLPASRKPLHAPSRSLANQAQPESAKSSKGFVLQPIDAVLAFVETPSPIEALPSPILSGNKLGPHKLESKDPGNLQTGVGLRSISSGARIGLGLSIETVFDDSDSTIQKQEYSSRSVPDFAYVLGH